MEVEGGVGRGGVGVARLRWSCCGTVGAGEDDRGRALPAAERASLARCEAPSAPSDEMAPSSAAGFGGPSSSAATRALRAED